MRASAFTALALLAGCSVSIPDGRLECTNDTECPPGWGCAAGHCYAPGTDAGLDGGSDTPPDVPPDVPRDVPPDTPPDAPDGGPPEEPVSIACGNHHTCALTNLGRVFCWGDDGMGAVGNDSVADTMPITAAVLVAFPAGTEIEAIGAGDSFTCALDEGAAAYCWGTNAEGQLGDVGVGGANAPNLVPLATIVPARLAVGEGHACILSTDDRLYCWGRNLSDQLGEGGSDLASRPSPVEPFAARTFDFVSTGNVNTCAVRTTGEVECWGSNATLQLGTVADPPGTGAFSTSSTPIAVPVAGATSAVSLGLHTCAYEPGGISCFGWNNQGQLGLPMSMMRDRIATPTPLPLASRPELLAGGDDLALFFGGGHTCAAVDGEISCWGWNAHGQLGNGTMRSSEVPSAVPGLAGVTALAAGPRHTCAVASGTAYCWGWNDLGQLGNGNQTDSPVPTSVMGLPRR
jgi:alpha-tubulin suppressor-like RCC1 family protein